MKLSTAILIALMASPVFAAYPYYHLDPSTTTGKTTYSISGKVAVAASSVTYQTYLVTIDGTNGYNSTLQVTASSGTYSGPITASQFNGSGAGLTAIPSAQLSGSIPVGLVNLSSVTTALSSRVAKSGDTMTGGLTLLTSSVTAHNATSGTAYGAFRFYDDSPNNPVATIGMNSVGTKTELVTCAGGSNCGPGAGGYSWAADGNTMGFNTSGVLSAPSFSGPLTGLASLNLPLTGGTLTGPLTLAGSSLTVTGNAFSVGTSTFVVAGGKVGVGTANPPAKLTVNGTTNGLGNVSLGLYSGVGSKGPKLHFSDSVNYNFAIGTTDDTTGDLVFNSGGQISVVGTERMRIKQTGLVGIGTTSPDQKLTVAGNISATGVFISSGTDNNYFAGKVFAGGVRTDVTAARLVVSSGAVVYAGALAGVPQSEAVVLDRQSGGVARLMTADNAGGWNANLAINPYGGMVGIRTAAPTASLQVVGLVEYADNAAALAAGLTAGAFYRTGDVLKVVH